MMKVSYSYLNRQFAETEPYLDGIRELVKTGDFTLGKAVTEFEERFAALIDIPYAVGVGSGTDALLLSLEILGIGYNDEVITAANTFVATAGAIATCGAKPVFVDSNYEFTIDITKIENAISSHTKAIVPVHLSGCPANMPEIMKIANRNNLIVIEDAAQAILASIDGTSVGSWGSTAAFSLHPLKNLNIWGDGGVIVTRSEELRDKLRLFRNHGMSTRDEIAFWGHNSRLDSLQALVANRLMPDVEKITYQRIENARKYDEAFVQLGEYISIPPRRTVVKQVYHTYMLRVKKRDELLQYLQKNGISAKVHYPVPLHLQPAAKELGYKTGDFPRAEEDARTTITLPVHQHLTPDEIDYVIDQVYQFYTGRQQ